MGSIRLLLAFSVLVAHSALGGKIMPPGDIAVQLFFIISGFYMTEILNTKYRNHTAAFYKNRFFRLYPIYICVLVLVLAFGFVASSLLKVSLNNWDSIANYYNSGTISLGTALFVGFSNVSMLFQDTIMFLKLHDGSPVFGYFGYSNPPIFKMLLVPQAWSLSLEILFYAIAPFCLKNRKRIVVLFIASIATRVLLHSIGKSDDPFTYRFFPSEISVFLLGALSWYLFRDFQSPMVKKYLVHIQIATCIVLVFWPHIFTFNDLGRYLFFVPFALLVPYLYQHYRENKTDNRVGELSYPFYLTHLLSLQISELTTRWLFGESSFWAIQTVVFAFILTIVFSILLLALVQRHFDGIRRNTVLRMEKQQNEAG